MSESLKTLIARGENQQLDFKYCISDSRKIARTLSAFANSDGGTLLIGVRDNGSIAGVMSDEEYYMIDAAASLYCKPEVKYTMNTHRTGSRTVLEVKVKRMEARPCLAKSDDGRWLAWVRRGDQNLLANRVILKVWKLEQQDNRRSILIRFRQPEAMLMEYLRDNGSISLSGFKRMASIPVAKAEKILSDFILLGIVDYELSEKGCLYVPGDEFDAGVPE
ncbi:MAG: helix-turn-helix domain-containing protein [Bacteroidales bacterium]